MAICPTRLRGLRGQVQRPASWRYYWRPQHRRRLSIRPKDEAEDFFGAGEGQDRAHNLHRLRTACATTSARSFTNTVRRLSGTRQTGPSICGRRATSTSMSRSPAWICRCSRTCWLSYRRRFRYGHRDRASPGGHGDARRSSTWVPRTAAASSSRAPAGPRRGTVNPHGRTPRGLRRRAHRGRALGIGPALPWALPWDDRPMTHRQRQDDSQPRTSGGGRGPPRKPVCPSRPSPSPASTRVPSALLTAEKIAEPPRSSPRSTSHTRARDPAG